ncbi:hypothetical protein [Brevundimonas balnearis]|uniref:Uncharacterized protein n=1 Tax=Brevundimonas balnearis TaxID=1572858 RepID=A0ABV6R1H6_9CAUL
MTDTQGETHDGFQTDDVAANRAIEQGLGVGARELQAQRDPGGVNTADEDVERVDGEPAGPDERLDESLGVQGGLDQDDVKRHR